MIVVCQDVPSRPLARTGRSVGLDLGIHALVATSDGELVAAPRYARSSADRLAAAQRDLSTKQRGSNRRRRVVERVACAHRKARNQRSDFAHKLSRRLVDEYDLVVHEDLKIPNMTRRPAPRPDGDGDYLPNGAAAKSGLNRSILDAGWGDLLQKLTYKAADAGRELVAVDPRHTSQRCAGCGHVDRESRITQAQFRCTSCGHEANADCNAALNILEAGRASQLSSCGASNPTRYPTLLIPKETT